MGALDQTVFSYGDGVSDAWQVVDTVSTRFGAEVLAARLRDSGIPAVITADDVGGWVPELLKMRGVAVLVANTDVEAAVELLAGSAPRQPEE